jgi:polyribonucleotide nucleotidyltransferase
MATAARRAVALVIDWFLALGVSWLLFDSDAIATLMVFATMHILGITLLATTVGKAVCRTQVVRLGGRTAPVHRVVVRTALLCLVLPAVVVGPDGRGMHDKVAGTVDGITSLQMDIKITSITMQIMEVALGQAKDGRMHILGEMAKAITGNRTEVAQTAPRISIINVPKEKVREVIGTGGKVIREIVENTGCKIDIEDDGTIKVASNDATKAQAAIDWIRGIVAEPEVGVIYNGKVVKTAEFGAFVNFLGSKDGLVHISELQQGRVNKTTDVVNMGDQVKVKVIGFDDRGKVKLSMRVVDQATGADISAQVGPKGGGERERGGERGERGGERRERRDRPDRGDGQERSEAAEG